MKKNGPKKTPPKLLFICKVRNQFYGPSFGLINSCRFIANALAEHGIESKVVQVIDNNSIDREVHLFRPTHVFIEALWVTPSKFEELIPRYPKIEWYVRIHSKIPFLAHEGVAMHWLREYYELSKKYDTLHIAANNEAFVESFLRAYGIPVEYLPNIYCPPQYVRTRRSRHDSFVGKTIDIGCFGAIRPMKNHLNQALAAITFGNETNLKVRFHINSDRCEQKGDSVLKNLVYAFEGTRHKLVNHPWMNHCEFIPLVETMELGMQVSYSETFNIVAADFVWNNVPVIGSKEISWLDEDYQADPNNLSDMVRKLKIAYHKRNHDGQRVNLRNLVRYNRESTRIWLNAI